MKKTESKREKEKRIVRLMIRLYCREKHGGRKDAEELCEECRELEDYAALRVDKCPFMETKTFCSNCRVHCYRPEMREKIRRVMRTADAPLPSGHGTAPCNQLRKGETAPRTGRGAGRTKRKE